MEYAMSNSSLVTRVVRNGKAHLVIDFYFTDSNGNRQRYRRDADAQTLTAARAEAQRLIDLAASTGSPYPRERRFTLGRFVAEVYRPLFVSRLRPGTRERYERILRRQVLPYFDATPLAEIDGMMVRRFDTWLQAEHRLKSPKHIVTMLRCVLRAAVESGELEEYPTRLPTYSHARKLPSCPSMEEIRLLLEHCTTAWLRTAVALMAYAGLRVSEARALRVLDVDLERGVIFVRRTFSGEANGGEIIDATKGGDQRAVPIAEMLRPYLVEAIRGKLPHAPILVSADGRIPRRQRVYDRLRRAAERAGLGVISPHKHRHAFCSALVRAGANVEAVRLLAGHSDLKTTARYLHAVRGDLQAAVVSLGQAVGNGKR
jgi:integrase/recombinase XerC